MHEKLFILNLKHTCLLGLLVKQSTCIPKKYTIENKLWQLEHRWFPWYLNPRCWIKSSPWWAHEGHREEEGWDCPAPASSNAIDDAFLSSASDGKSSVEVKAKNKNTTLTERSYIKALCHFNREHYWLWSDMIYTLANSQECQRRKGWWERWGKWERWHSFEWSYGATCCYPKKRWGHQKQILKLMDIFSKTES